MSEELEVRSEELAAKVKEWIDLLLHGDHGPGWEAALKTASVGLIEAVAEEIVRMTKERKYLLQTAASEWLCGSCRHGVMAGKPCPNFDDINDCEDCGKCICGECNDGDKWVWDGKER